MEYRIVLSPIVCYLLIWRPYNSGLILSAKVRLANLWSKILTSMQMLLMTLIKSHGLILIDEFSSYAGIWSQT